MLQTKVKASSVSNLTDARYFAAWDVDWLGFCLDENAPDYVSPPTLRAFREWVDGPAIVGEFGLQSLEEILELATDLELDAIQLGPFADHSIRAGLREWFVIQEVVVSADTSWSDLESQLEEMAGEAGLFLLNLDSNRISLDDLKQGRPFSDIALKELCDRFPILLGMNWRVTEVPSILETLSPEGIYVRGGEEEKVGFKSFDELDDLFELLEVLV
ncbi:MAG: N-(5'-phosphoribosyl)anthranilate isomerase [Saprospiraceae bacterium]|nr:N-(5'-phosphoribosyl)anthranilate isomerase [Saprospiraceae bacterium]